MRLEPRERLLEASLDVSPRKFRISPTADGFLTIVVNGEDTDWTHAQVVVRETTSLNPQGNPIAALSWSYSAQQSFAKAAMATVPLRRGEAYELDWTNQRNANKLSMFVDWMPLAP